MRVVYVCSSQYMGYTAAVAELDRCQVVESAAIQAAIQAQVAADIAIAAWEALEVEAGVPGFFFSLEAVAGHYFLRDMDSF